MYIQKKTYRCMWISYPIICHAEETRKKQSSGFIWLPLHVQHPYTKPQYAVISDTPSPCKGWVSHVFFRTDMLSGHASGGFEYTLWSSNMAGRSMKSEITATLVHFQPRQQILSIGDHHPKYGCK